MEDPVDEEIDDTGDGEKANSENVQGKSNGMDLQGDEVEVAEQEAQAPRAARSPHQPSQREVDEHEITHCPPRSWCDHCVKGQFRDEPHRLVTGEFAESSVVRVAMDYCFFTEDVAAEESEHIDKTTARVSMTVLVLVESMCRSIWAYAVQGKGAGEQWVAEQIAEDLETIGITEERLILKADQEPSITELQRNVAKVRAGHGTAIEQSRVGDSNSNGRVERAIQDFKGLTRTMRSALEDKIKSKISLNDPIVPWMVRHAASVINSTRVRENGRTAYQQMKGRRSNSKMVCFGETVLFKIPKTQHRIGSFEDRWESGCWVGSMVRSGEHLVGTGRGVFKVSTIMRRTVDKRWSEQMVKDVVGTPEEPVPGLGSRRVPAYAKKFHDDSAKNVVYTPQPEIEEEIRPAQILKKDVEEHGGTDRCPGCKALRTGKYRAKHTAECRQRFEKILEQNVAARRRFERAKERKMDAVTKRAVEIQEGIDKDSKGKDADTPVNGDGKDAAAGASGSGLGDAERRAGVDSQNEKTMKDAMQESKTTSTPKSPRGTKREAEDEPDDSERLQRDAVAEQSGVKRKPDVADDSARMQDRSDDMSSIVSGHPGPVNKTGHVDKEDKEWHHVGSGIFARTFTQMSRLMTTSKGGPRTEDVHRRVIRSLESGKVIDDCIIDDTPDHILNRHLKIPGDYRVELTMKGAMKLFTEKGPDVSEVYSNPRIVQEAAIRSYGGLQLKPGWSLDLTLNDPMTGEPWDLSKAAVRQRVRKLVVETKPFMLIGSPPCTLFSTLQNLSRGKRDNEKFEKEMNIAKKHIWFCIELYQLQMEGGRYFLHEHPEGATSWKLPEIIKLAAKEGVETTVCDMCAFGMTLEDDEGTALVEKSTKFLTNSPEVCKRISKRCTNRKPNHDPVVESGERLCVPADEAAKPKLPGGVPSRGAHRHASLLGGRARKCQVYPREFCKAVCAGISAQKKLFGLGLRAEPLMSIEAMSAVTPGSDGDPSRELHEDITEYMLGDGTVAWDDQSGASLKPALMVQARREEIQYFKDMKVYEKVMLEECWEQTGKGPIDVRWVDINKGDEVNPNYRSRLVAKEFKDDLKPELYAATPPSECLRMILSKLASQKDARLLYADVSRAYFYAKAVRPVYVRLPSEDRESGDEGKCGKLRMSMYGTRDAALNWSMEYTSTLLASGFVQGKASPCLFHHPQKQVAVMVHGDDFIAVGSKENVKHTEDVLREKYKIKVEHLGDGPECVKEVKILNKIVRYTTTGVELEADPRHAEMVINDLGLKGAKGSTIPGSKAVRVHENMKARVDVAMIVDEEDYTNDEVLDMITEGEDLDSGDESAPEEEGDEELEGEEATRYRAIAARLNYLAVDRVDLQYSVKEAARNMSKPLQKHWQMLAKIGRYLINTPRLVMSFPWQDEPTMVTVFTDSDWAGCVKSAKSTSGGIVTIGDHVIKTYSRQQRVIALSSAEAELYAMVAASAEGLACIALARDLGVTIEGEVYTDSSAALGISQRAGLGKVRHLRTQGLWIQEVHATKRLSYRKVLGSKNPSDVLTKYLSADLMSRHLEAICAEKRGGRADAAPELNSLVSEVLWSEPLRDFSKHVQFAPSVLCRGIPAANTGRSCKSAVKTRMSFRPASKDALPGGAGELAVKKSWADMSEDQESPGGDGGFEVLSKLGQGLPELRNANVDVNAVDVLVRDGIASAQTAPSEGGASDRGLCLALKWTSGASMTSIDPMVILQEPSGGFYVSPGLELPFHHC